MADLLSTLLGGGKGSGTAVTNSVSSEALKALQSAYNINANAAQNTGVDSELAAKAIAEATKGIQSGAAAVRGSGAYSSAALQVARDKALAEAANSASIESAKLQQQSAAQAAGAAANLANATKVTTTGSANPEADRMLDIMKALAIGERTSAASSSSPAGSKTTATGSTIGDTVANKALSYGGRIAQVGLTSMLGKAALGLNPVLGAGVMLAGSDVIKAGTGALTDWLGEALGLKKKTEDVTAAATAETLDPGMVDFVNAASSAGFDMGTTVDATSANESAFALADLLGVSPSMAGQILNDDGSDTLGNQDWKDFTDAAATDFKSEDQLGYEADRGSWSDTFGGGGGNDNDYSDTRDSLF